MVTLSPSGRLWVFQTTEASTQSLPDGDGVDGLVGGLLDRLVDREGDPSLAMFVVGGGGQG